MSVVRSEVVFRASTASVCPVCCTGTKGCSATKDELHFCRGEPNDFAKWNETSKTVDAAGFRCFRRADDKRYLANGAQRNVKSRTPHPKPNAKLNGPQTWREQAEKFAGQSVGAIAVNLNLPAEAFNGKLPVAGLGYTEFGSKLGDGTWTGAVCFPMVDGQREPCGIVKRLDLAIADTTKYSMPGSKLGIILGLEWTERPGPLLIVEGGSDTVAISLCGLAVLGRPSNVTGAEILSELLADFPQDRPIVVIGENDQKPDGKWPGRDGIDAVVPKLAKLLGRAVLAAYPPEHLKDCRDWVRELLADQAELDMAAIGELVRRHVEGTMDVPIIETKDALVSAATAELLVESLDGLRPKPVKWNVPNLIPAGMLGMLAGEGGHGKSVTTHELAAAITSARCAFGLDYSNPVQGKVLLVSCEDDWERTIVPRLATLGADLTRVLRIRGVKMKADGQTLDFHLGHFAELDNLLRADRDIRLVVIDPAGAYIGRAGVNESRDADLRAILGPLSETANNSGATVLLVKHLNKSANVSAVQRVSGSAGYVNACRFAYVVAPDPEDTERKLMMPMKANVLPSGQSGLAYRLESLTPDEARGVLMSRWPDLPAEDLDALSTQLFRQRWESGVSIDVNALTNGKPKRERESVHACAAFIKAFLGLYAWPQDELEAAAEKAGYSFRTRKAAKANLRCEPDESRLSSRPRGEGGPWWCWIGQQSRRPPDRPESSASQTDETVPD